MSLRYAHLAPDRPRETVAKLNQQRLLTLTMHLEQEGSPAVSGCVFVLFPADGAVVEGDENGHMSRPPLSNPALRSNEHAICVHRLPRAICRPPLQHWRA